jgi:hypothetical protein
MHTSVANLRCLSRILTFFLSVLGLWIPDKAKKEERGRMCFPIFFCSHKHHKIENYFIFEQMKLKI